MRSYKNLFASAALATVVGAGFSIAATPASAYTTCNTAGDCWHTDERIQIPGVTLAFHDDKWADAHRTDSHYKWHEADNDHDWHQGYWANGEWHAR